MKACIVLQNQYSKVGHAIALYLKERYQIDSFSAYVFSRGAYDFVRSQRDINYSPILADHELHVKYQQETVDLDYIKRFENNYQPPELWRYFYSDRKLMMSIGPKEETTTVIDPLYKHEDLLRIFQARAKAIEKMLSETKPDFILFFSLGALGHMLLYHTAKKLQIKTCFIDLARIGNLHTINNDFKTSSGVMEYFNNDMPGQFAGGEEQNAMDLLQNFRKTGSLDLEYLKGVESVRPISNRTLLPTNIIQTIRYLLTLTKNYTTNDNNFAYGETSLNPARFVLYKLRQRYRKLQGLESLYSQPEDGEDFAFFPLHYEPEMAILLLSPFYFDQVALLRIISRSLPLHFKLYVKEHPSMVFKRPKSYYKELLKLPNLKLIPHTVSSFDLIKKAKLITVITGTAGWEACFLGKPVITFGDIFYNALSFVRRVHNLESLPEVIREQLNNFQYNEREMIRLLASIFKDTAPFNITSLWYEADPQKLKNDRGLRLVADNLIKNVTGSTK